MPRMTHVKKAQQRYVTVPVIDPETGEQKRVPVMGRDGNQKQSKRGPVWMRLTREDRSQPKAMPRCDAHPCVVAEERIAAGDDRDANTIRVGDAYKTISPKSGPYGGRDLYRHERCPSWQVWEYSSSLSARLAQVDHDARTSLDESSVDSVRDALTTAAEGVREIAGEKEEAAQNIEDGFGHETEQSSELRQQAEDLDAWADELDEAANGLPDEDRPEEEPECETCQSSGTVQDAEGNEPECPDCGGSGITEPEGVDEWDEAVAEALAVLDACPV